MTIRLIRPSAALSPRCGNPSAFGRCIAPEGHKPANAHRTLAHLALFSASVIAQLEQAQWSLRNELRSVSGDDKEWAYAFDTAVPMIYGGYFV